MANILPGEGRDQRSTSSAERARSLHPLPRSEGGSPGEAVVFANIALTRFEAHVHGQVVAMLAYAEVPDEPSALELTHTVVRPGYADHGWGEALILQVLRWLEDREVEPVVRCPLVRRVCDTLDSLGPNEPFVFPGSTGGTGFADAG